MKKKRRFGKFHYKMFLLGLSIKTALAKKIKYDDPNLLFEDNFEGDEIDTRKWVCVGADEKIVAGYGDTVMLIMLDSQLGLSAQSYVDAFKSVCGGELDFTI